MSEDTTVKDPGSDSSANSQTGQTAADSKVATATVPPVTSEDYKNVQAAYTRSQQELKSLKDQFTAKDQEYAEKFAKAQELEASLRQAFGNAAPVEPQLAPEQVAELDRLFQQTPTYKTLSEQTRTQQVAQQTAAQRQHDLNVNEAAAEVTRQFQITDEQGANLRKFILEDPALAGGIQYAATKEQALRTFRNAFMAWDYDNLKKNSVALGTKQVEQNLKAMEAVSSVDQGTQQAAGAGNADVQYVPGRGLDGVWDNIKAKTLQELNVH